MDNLPQEQTPAEPKKNSLLEGVEFGVGGVVIGIGTFLLMLFVLNYFNIVSLSTVFPKYFAWLPHRAIRGSTPRGVQPLIQTSPQTFQNSPTPIQSGPTPTPTKLTLSCPVPKEFCNQAKIIKEGDFNALGFTLPKGTTLQAVFEGKVSDQPKPAERSPNQPLLYLRDDQGNEVIYSFYGSSSASLTSQTVPKGAEIGVIGEETFPPYPPLSGLNFLFTVKSEGKYAPVDPNQFK